MVLEQWPFWVHFKKKWTKMGTLFGFRPHLRGMSGSVPAPPDLKRISGGEFVQILNSGNLRKLCATGHA
jgi:hypothetical protein